VEKGEDTTHVYKDGYKIEYFGVIDPDTFVSWLMDIPDEPLTIINTDFEIEEFENLADITTRVIGYFEPGGKVLFCPIHIVTFHGEHKYFLHFKTEKISHQSIDTDGLFQNFYTYKDERLKHAEMFKNYTEDYGYLN
uniref:Calsequestrin n=1 Tax=Romanomermis culicivorax TaxID=13658 RepID=A0A915KER5_ROMCU